MAEQLPDYIRSNVPNPPQNRAPWYKNTAPTYAGIFLWVVFWDTFAGLGLKGASLGTCLLALVVSALVCHGFFYLVPGLFGLKTGRPLYIVGTSTFGAQGGFLMPGFLMGLLQFGWVGANTFVSSTLLLKAFGYEITSFPNAAMAALCLVWALTAAFMGLKGIQYVAKVATYLPLIPVIVLIYMLFNTGTAAPGYTTAPEQGGTVTAWLAIVGYVVGFFATAGAAGVDFGTNSRDSRDVNWGGLIGIAGAIIFAAGLSLIVVAGAHAKNPALESFVFTEVMQKTINPGLAKVFMIALALASFPSACFSSFIAANSFKTTLPKVNPFISVGIGAVFSFIIAAFGWAGNLAAVFGIIGASFGPICGALFVEYFLSGRKWSGPRAGFNPAGWGAWLVGFIIGILPNGALVSWGLTKPGQFSYLEPAPVVAFVVGAVVFLVLAKMGLQSRLVPIEETASEKAAAR